MTDDIKAKLRSLSTPDVADVLRKLGVTKVVMRGVRPLVSFEGSIAGPARTLRLLPDREDLGSTPAGAVNRALYESLAPGEVLVLDAMGEVGRAVIGGMMFGRVSNRGAAAVVVDGAVRDVQALTECALPVFALASAPESFRGWLRPSEADVAIQCGGVRVEPGDWLIGDAEGVVVIPASLVAQVAEMGVAQRRLDLFSAALLDAGFGLDDAYPLPAHMERFIDAFGEDGRLPTVMEVAEARSGGEVAFP